MHVAPASEMTYTVSGGALKKLYSIQSNPDLLIPELTDASTSRYLLYVSGTLSLAWYSRQNSQQDLSPVSSEAISQVVWNPVLSVHCMQQLEWRHVLFTSGKGRTQVVSVQWTTSCRNYSRTGCFKNCKNITTVGRVMLWLLFLWHSVFHFRSAHCCAIHKHRRWYWVLVSLEANIIGYRYWVPWLLSFKPQM